MRTLRQLYATVTLTYISFFVLCGFFEESIVHVALVSAYCICKKNLLEKRQLTNKFESSGKSILRRPPKIALTIITVSIFFKHFLLGRLRVRGLT